jgi:N-acetylneuraminic acid mutarotase
VPRYKPAACNSLTAAQQRSAVPVARCFAMGYADPAGKLVVRPAAAGPPATALGPQQIQDAYKLPAAGTGETVAVVDAFGYTSAESDLAVYRSYYGLPACTTANGCFTVAGQTGGATPPDNPGSGWTIETALDLDAVSAACPKCKILLVQADSDAIGDLGQAVDTAASMGAVAISNSYGVAGEDPSEQSYDQYYDHPGIAVTASTGDTGNVQSWPATSPDVAGVGGTTLTADSGTARGWTESAWAGGGSGCSLYEARPAYQAGLTTGCPANKATSDISADADPASGLGMYNTAELSGWGQYGGTSLASPLVAAMYALAGTPTPGTYPVSYPYQDTAGLNDVTTGSDGSCGNVLCQAGPGWDGPTGLGTPNGVGALTQGATGQVTGTVTDASSGAPVSGVTIAAADAAGNSFTATTGSAGTYDLYAPAGSYTVTATKFGYAVKTVSGVSVTVGASVPENFTLTAEPSQTVSGYVTDGSGHGWPMRAKITISGYPDGAIYSDPYTGHYSVNLPAGVGYTMHVTAADLPGYTSQDVTVDPAGTAVRQDIALKVDAATCTAPGYAYREDGTTEAFTGWPGKTPQDGWTITDNAGTGQTWEFDNPGGWAPPPGGDADFADIDSDYYGSGGKQDTSLISPVVNLTGKDNPEIGFDTTYIGFPGQTGSVDLSLDGGTTWSTVWTPYSVNPGHVDIPVPQAAGVSDVRVRFHFTGSWSRRWELDNVLIGVRSCAATAGGLVAGIVKDANTGSPLNGATVTSDTDQTVLGVTSPASGDPALTGGYYWLFSPHTGQTSFTVTDGNYAPTRATVNVPASSVRHANFGLDAGRLTVGQQSISTSEVLGAAASKTVTFGNDGTAPLHVSLGQDDAGFTPMAGTRVTASGAPAMVVKTTTSVAATAGTAPASGHPARQASPATGPWTGIADYPAPVMDDAVADHAGKIYVLGGSDGTSTLDSANVYDPATNSWSAIANLPEPLNAASAAFLGNTLYVTGGWDIANNASTHTYAYNLSTNKWTQVADLPAGVAAAGSAVAGGRLYVIGGCTTSQCTPDSKAVYSYDPGNDSWNTEPDYPAPVAFIACGGVLAKVVCAGGVSSASLTSTYAYTPGASGWTQESNLPVDAWGAASAAANGKLEIMGGAIDNGSAVTNQGFAYDPNANTWTALPDSNNATYRGGAACGIYKVGGSPGSFNPVQAAETLPGYDQCGGSVTWMSQNKTEFDLAPGQTVSVHVTTDSSVVSQPGTYKAQLTVDTNSPYRGALPVGVTMQVTPPKTWGKVAGTVTGSTGKPIIDATVAICTMYDTQTGTCGPVTYTVKTGAGGAYQLWLNKRFNPLEIIAAKDGYTPVMKITRIRKGATTTARFALVEVSVSP